MLLVSLAVCLVSVFFAVFRNAYFYDELFGWIGAFIIEAANSFCPLVFASYIRPEQEFSTSFCIIYSLVCLLRFILYVMATVFGVNRYYFLGVYFLNFAFIMQCFGADWEVEVGAEPTFAKYGSIGFVLMAITMFVTPFHAGLSWFFFCHFCIIYGWFWHWGYDPG